MSVFLVGIPFCKGKKHYEEEDYFIEYFSKIFPPQFYYIQEVPVLQQKKSLHWQFELRWSTATSVCKI